MPLYEPLARGAGATRSSPFSHPELPAVCRRCFVAERPRVCSEHNPIYRESRGAEDDAINFTYTEFSVGNDDVGRIYTIGSSSALDVSVSL